MSGDIYKCAFMQRGVQTDHFPGGFPSFLYDLLHSGYLVRLPVLTIACILGHLTNPLFSFTIGNASRLIFTSQDAQDRCAS
jgi:hypothetical protein